MPATRILCPVCKSEMEVFTHATAHIQIGSGDEKRYMELMADIRLDHLKEMPSCRNHPDWARGWFFEPVVNPASKVGEYHTVWVRMANNVVRLGICAHDGKDMHWADPVTMRPLPAMVIDCWALDPF